jgi:hypothetical protein
VRRVSNSDVSLAKATVESLAQGQPVARADLASAVRVGCAVLEHLHRGKTLELRVPPFAAVQVGSADRGAHTRGTPPNVVETDPATFLALIGGSLSWREALAAHRVAASGPHTDLADWFPVSLADPEG